MQRTRKLSARTGKHLYYCAQAIIPSELVYNERQFHDGLFNDTSSYSTEVRSTHVCLGDFGLLEWRRWHGH